MLDGVQAALDAMVSNEAPAAALQEVLQPAGAYADSMIALLTCTAASAAEVRHLSAQPCVPRK